MKKIILLILALATPLMAQVSNPSIILVTNAPSGSCGGGLPMEYIFSTGVLYGCQNGTWATFATGGGGTGTVTSVSVTTANGVSGWWLLRRLRQPLRSPLERSRHLPSTAQRLTPLAQPTLIAAELCQRRLRE